MNGLRIAKKINALTVLCALIAVMGIWLILGRMQANGERHQQMLTSFRSQLKLVRQVQVDFREQVQEWKDILLRGREPADLERYRSQFFRKEQRIREEVQVLSRLLEQPAVRERVAEFLQAHEDLGQRYRKALDVFLRGGASDHRAADLMVRDADRPPTHMIDAIAESVTREFDSYRAGYEVELARERRETALAIVGLFLVLSGTSALFVQHIVRPIRNLIGIVSRVSAEKDYSLRVARDSHDEFGLLADGINDMLEQIQAQTRELIRSRQELTDILDNAAEGLHWLDPDGRVLWVNRGELRASGFARDEFVGHVISEFQTDADVAGDMLSRMRRGEPLYNYEARFTCKNGSVVDLLINTNPIMDQGKLILTRCFCRDITKRKRAETELRRLNSELETRVSERTRQLEDTHKQLQDAARSAGMAEVATNVLHNVGNVLNSVNISASLVAQHARTPKAARLAKVVALLRQHEGDLATFMATDSRGQHLVAHLDNLASHLQAEEGMILHESESLQANIEHIKEIVTMQQRYATTSGVKEIVSVVDLVEDSLRLNAESLGRHRVEVVRDFRDRPLVNLDKHQVLQILVNLVRNAKQACESSHCSERRVTLRLALEQGRCQISVIDNGVGIAAENLNRIFNHGFTTRASGHGFGLHSGALAAKCLGGSLTVRSEGPGRGACFTLELPVHSVSEQSACA